MEPECSLVVRLQDMEHWPFTVVDKEGSPLIQVEYLNETKTFTPQEISSMVLIKMKEISEAKLGKTVKKAVVTYVEPLEKILRLALNRGTVSFQRPRLLQRLATTCYQGRWCHRWS